MFRNQKRLKAAKSEYFFYFVALAVVFSISFFFLLLANFKNYKTEISILFIPKNADTAMQAEPIIENLTELPRQLSFYDKLLKDGGMDDPYGGLPKDQRKKMWNKKLNVKRVSGSSIINISIASKNRAESLSVSKQAAKTLFSSASRYYNIKKDIDLRIIDGPITAPVANNWPWLVLLSAVFGIIFSYSVIIIFQKISGLTAKRKTVSFQKKDIESKPETKEDIVAAPYAGKLETAAKKYKAPDNLPVADSGYPFPEEFIMGGETGQAAALAEKMKHRDSAPSKKEEPTEEELKERLNQLLKGKF